MWRDEAYILDILIAARKIRGFVESAEFGRFERSEMTGHVRVAVY